MRLHLSILFCLYLFCAGAIAQSPTLDVVGAGTGLTGYAGFYDPLGKKKILEYKEIEGSCFWDDKWNPALVTLKNGKELKLAKARLNFYSNEIHYLDNNNEEFVFLKGIANKIAFVHSKDTTKVIGVFQNYNHPELGASFAQVLNDGKIQLLKVVSITLKNLGYSQYRYRVVYRFASTRKYFILNDKIITPLVNVNKTTVLSTIKTDEATEKWLKSTKNKLRNEDDLIAFLSFYNLNKK